MAEPLRGGSAFRDTYPIPVITDFGVFPYSGILYISPPFPWGTACHPDEGRLGVCPKKGRLFPGGGLSHPAEAVAFPLRDLPPKRADFLWLLRGHPALSISYIPKVRGRTSAGTRPPRGTMSPMSETPKLPRLPKLSPGGASSSSAPAKPSKPNPRHPYALGGQGRTLGEMLPSLGDLTGYPNGIGGLRSKDS